MKTKIFTFFLALVANVGTLFAEKVKIGILYYYLNAEDSTAEVTSSPDLYAGDITLPSVVSYESIAYTVTSIGSNAFAGCSSMTSITIPEGIEKIGYHAFAACRGLTKITIPNSVTDIYEAFYNCDGLPVENNIRYADTYAIEAIDKTLSTYSVKDGTRWLGGVFWSCSNMTSVNLPHSLEYIEYGAFYECSSLASITIPINVKNIDIYTFYGCTNLLSVTFNARNCHNGKTLGGHPNTLFSSGSVETITFGNEVETIPSLCCDGLSKLTSVDIPNSVKRIEPSAFSGCTGLRVIDIPNSVISIESGAFDGCTGLIDVIVGKGVKNFDSNAFIRCANIKNVVWNAVNCEMPSHSIFGTQVVSFSFGADIETIPDYCCMNMDKLISINIPGRVKTIGKSAFLGCTGLTSMDIPNSVTNIEQWAFWGCANIESMRIGNGITDIGGFTFNGCSGLTNFTCEAIVPPTCDIGVFYYIDKSIPLYVPAGSEDAYRTAAYWEEFYNIQAIAAESLESVGDKVTKNKILRDGQIYILMPNGQKYSIVGELIK